MILSIRYIFNSTIQEDFVTFAHAYNLIKAENVAGKFQEHRLTGVDLGHGIADFSKNFDLDLELCVYGVDNCSMIASEANVQF